MQRRTFLAAAALGAVRPVLAQHAGHDMSGMSHMPDMSGHGHQGPHIADTAAPAAKIPALPEGQPLRELPRLANTAMQPGLFKASLSAAPATHRFAPDLDTPALAYNGMSVGPLIEAYEGDHVEIAFSNDIPGEDSTIHWHGMPVPADQDGNPMDAVPSGGRRVYAFDLPEDSAASYWYHPHPHGLTAEQVYRGLAGMFVVKSRRDPVPAAYGDTALILTDLRLAADGSMPPSTMVDMMNGRVGDHLLVNGQKNPSLHVRRGEKRRLRLCNATNARFLKLAFESARMTLIGTDGGLLEAPVPVEDILLAPAERIELVVAFDQAGSARLRTMTYERGWMGPGKPDESDITLLTAQVSNEAAVPAPPLPARLRRIASLGPEAQTRRFVMSESMPMGFFINGAAFDMKRIDAVARLDEVELWEVENQADMDHPFHVHGTQFQVVEHERDGAIRKPDYLAWKDTVNVTPGETVRLRLRQTLPGPRMYHCHILEHEQLGMMGILDVRATV